MRVCCIADLHGRLPDNVPECELLIVAGDIGADRREENERFLRREFPSWLERQPAAAIVGIAGNHDFVAARWPSIFRSFPWVYLENEAATIGGVRIWGSPWTPRIGHWAFMAADEQLAQLWRLIPDDVEVLVTHGPPYGFLDRSVDGRRCGSRSLQQRILELERLQLHVCGHVHEGYGVGKPESGVRLVNASLLNERYELVNSPIVVRLDRTQDAASG